MSSSSVLKTKGRTHPIHKGQVNVEYFVRRSFLRAVATVYSKEMESLRIEESIFVLPTTNPLRLQLHRLFCQNVVSTDIRGVEESCANLQIRIFYSQIPSHLPRTKVDTTNSIKRSPSRTAAQETSCLLGNTMVHFPRSHWSES
jgi:hypothetical protein